MGRVLGALNRLPVETMPFSEAMRIRLGMVPAGSDVLIVRPGLNADERNHAIYIALFTGLGPEVSVMSQLLETVFETPFFNTLRTEKQLGYIVQSQVDRSFLVSRLSLVIQSSVATPDVLLGAVDEFLKSFRGFLASCPPSSSQPTRWRSSSGSRSPTSVSARRLAAGGKRSGSSSTTGVVGSRRPRSCRGLPCLP